MHTLRRLLAVLGVAGLLGTIICLWAYMYQESYDHAGNAIVEAMEQGNADKILSYMSPEERSVTGANKGTMTRLLNEYVRPRIADFRNEGGVALTTGRYTTDAEQVLVNSSGRKIGITICMSRDGRKIVVKSMIDSLVWTAMLASLPKGKPIPLQREKLVYMEAVYTRDQGALERTGIHGSLWDSGETTQAFHSWAECRKEVAASLARYDARVTAAQNPNREQD